MNKPKSCSTEWVRKSEFRGKYQPPPDTLPFPWWYLVILAVLGIIAVTFAVISWNARADGYVSDIWESNWMTGYTQEEGFGTEWTTTSNGTKPFYGTVAVDSTAYEYGTIFYWPEYAEKYGRYGMALDSGSGVIGRHLDWWYLTNAEAAAGTKQANVRILRYGWSDWVVDPVLWGLTP